MAPVGATSGAAGGVPGPVRYFVEVDSTNRMAADLARRGFPEGVVVVADHQTAGRGRRGRSWEAPPGSSLLVSVLLRAGPGGMTGPAGPGGMTGPAGPGGMTGPAGPGGMTGPLSLSTVACGLAASDACGEVAGFLPRLKWPNDLVVDGRKLGGVLAEVVDGDPPAVVVGLGLNLAWPVPFPDHLADTAVTAEQVAGRAVGRDPLLAAFLRRLDRRLVALAGPDGQRATVEAYARRCDTLRREVRVERPGGDVLVGLAVGVAPDGGLVVASGGHRQVVTAGDVVHLTARQAPA